MYCLILETRYRHGMLLSSHMSSTEWRCIHWSLVMHDHVKSSHFGLIFWKRWRQRLQTWCTHWSRQALAHKWQTIPKQGVISNDSKAFNPVSRWLSRTFCQFQTSANAIWSWVNGCQSSRHSPWTWRGDRRHQAVVAVWCRRPSSHETRSLRRRRQNPAWHYTAPGTSPETLHREHTPV